MESLIEDFRQAVIRAAGDPAFVHHRWFVRWHLEIVERLALELCQIYPDADSDLVALLVWLHDYGKIVDRANEHAATLTAGRRQLQSLGFPAAVVDRAIRYVELIDAQRDLDRAPVEVRIVSSADGAAHLIGPFYALWWQENADKPFEELMADNERKALGDWQRKIVLPEVRAAFAQRQRLLLERCGQLPRAFLAVDNQAGGGA